MGWLEPLLEDPEITSIFVAKPQVVWVERGGKRERVEGLEPDQAQLLEAIRELAARAGRSVDFSSPLIEMRLPDGTRVNAAVTPVTFQGPALSIRKPCRDPLRGEDLVRNQMLTEEMLDLLAACVRARLNLVVSGSLGAGRTALLNVLAGAIPEDQRILTVEEEAQLRLPQPHVMRLEMRPPDAQGRGEIRMRDLLTKGLAMRPDRVVVDELQGREALDLLWKMRAGLTGCLLGIHASSPRDALCRLETLALLEELRMTPWTIRLLQAQTIQMLVHAGLFQDGSRRVTHVTECQGLKHQEIILHDLFVFQQTGLGPEGQVKGCFCGCGLRPRFFDRLREAGLAASCSIFELSVDVG